MKNYTSNINHIDPSRAGEISNRAWFEFAMLALGMAVMYGPTYAALDSQVWNIVGQGHGPVMLALVLWLGWVRRLDLLPLPLSGAPISGVVMLAVGAVLYIVGRSLDILISDVTSQIFILMGILLMYWGWPGVRVMWFPLFFIIFLIPLPGPIVDALTSPLKASVSWLAELLMHLAGYPVGREGVTLSIGPYKLLVADACAGLNSIFALEAIGVFYMSVVKHTSNLRNILLALIILPVSFLSNVIRVITLVMVTYYFGDAAGQGFVHGFAGILLFMVATALMISMDSILGLFFKADISKSEK
jgi:exosortase B